jgi:hypothetical protein
MTVLTILKASETELFDSPPCFTDEERSRFFVLPDSEVKFRRTETKIGYILLEGYFMCRKRFSLPAQYHTEDVQYVKKLIGTNRRIEIRKFYHKDTYRFYKQFILNRNGFHPFSYSNTKQLS